MKKYIAMFTVLLILFFLGLLIYDFSDEIDKKISNYTWYRLEENDMTQISFNNNQINYSYTDKEKPYSRFDKCDHFKYNDSIKLIKTTCSNKAKSIYINDSSDKYIVLSINSEEKTFYKTKNGAIEANFMISNEIEKEEFDKILDVDYNDFNLINEKEFIKLYNNKDFKVALINKDANLKNALNLKYLSKKILKEDIKVMLIDEIEDLEYLNSKSDIFPKEIDNFDKETINIYKIKNKKHSILEVINIVNYSDL